MIAYPSENAMQREKGPASSPFLGQEAVEADGLAPEMILRLYIP
jgi:hypothetical protein